MSNPKRQVHILQPIWNGDRTEVFVGIARRRVLDKKGQPAKGNIRVWIDCKETDTTSPLGWKLKYPYPFDIKCVEVLKYKEMVLNDKFRTVLHILPLGDLKEVRNYRSGSPRGRTMPQEEFTEIKQASLAVKRQEGLEHNDAK